MVTPLAAGQRWSFVSDQLTDGRRFRIVVPATPAHCQPLLAVKPLHPLLVDRMAFAPQQHMQATVAEPPPLLGQGFQPLTQTPRRPVARLFSARSSG
jgi:hypothetical protein